MTLSDYSALWLRRMVMISNIMLHFTIH